jgi:hypothetical protein
MRPSTKQLSSSGEETQPSAVSQFAKSVMEASDEEFDNYSDHDEEYEEIEVDEADAEIMSKFMPSAPRAQKTLADLIMQKIEAKNAIDAGEVDMQTRGNLRHRDWLKHHDSNGACTFYRRHRYYTSRSRPKGC